MFPTFFQFLWFFMNISGISIKYCIILWEPIYLKKEKKLLWFHCLLVTTVACPQCLGAVLQAGQCCQKTDANYTPDRQGDNQENGSLEKTTSPKEFHVMLNLIEEDFKSTLQMYIRGGRGLRGREGRQK